MSDRRVLNLPLSELRRRSSMKWRFYDPDVLPLWVAEMDVRLAEPVADALRDLVDRGDTGYPAGTAFAEAVAGFARVRWGWDGLDPARTVVVADVMTGVSEALALVTSPGDAVVVNDPVYPPFYGFVGHAGREVVESPLGDDGRLDLDGLAATFAQVTAGGRSAGYLLCNPQNPTGVVHTADELTAVAALAEEHGVRVVVDEIHAPLVLGGRAFTPYLSVPGGQRGMTLYSGSKGWNLAGVKAALLVAGPDAAADLARLPEPVTHGPSHLGDVAHGVAFAEGGPWLDDLLADVEANHRLLHELVATHLPGVRVRPAEGTFLAWLDCRGMPTLAEDPAGYWLEHARVALNDGRDFGTRGAGRARLNVATSPEVITAAVEQMATALART